MEIIKNGIAAVAQRESVSPPAGLEVYCKNCGSSALTTGQENGEGSWHLICGVKRTVPFRKWVWRAPCLACQEGIMEAGVSFSLGGGSFQKMY